MKKGSKKENQEQALKSARGCENFRRVKPKGLRKGARGSAIGKETKREKNAMTRECLRTRLGDELSDTKG